MEQQAAIPFAKQNIQSIKRENVQYIFPKFNFVGEKEQQQIQQLAKKIK